MRIADLFNEIDVDSDGSITHSEMGGMLERMLLPPADVQATLKLRKRRQVKKQQFLEQSERESRAIAEKVDAGEKSGANVLIAAFESKMRELMCRTVDLFSMIDTSGDNECDLDELVAVTRLLNLDVTRENVQSTLDYLDSVDSNGKVDARELEMAVRHYRRVRWEKRVIAMAKKAEQVAMLDKGIVSRKEAKAMVKYLACGYKVRNIPIRFFETALNQNKDCVDLNAATGPVRVLERMNSVMNISEKFEAATLAELWPSSSENAKSHGTPGKALEVQVEVAGER